MTTYWLKSKYRHNPIKCKGTHWLEYRKEDIESSVLRKDGLVGKYEIAFDLPKHFCTFIISFENYGDAVLFARKRKVFFTKVSLQNSCQHLFEVSNNKAPSPS